MRDHASTTAAAASGRLEERRENKNDRVSFGVVDLFAGIGCVAQGFARTGHFYPAVLTDNDRYAAATYKANFPSAKYLVRSVVDVRPGMLRAAAGDEPIAGILGCPPCQGFSAAGHRDLNDPRNALVRHYFRLVAALEPPFLLMENVPRVFEYELFQRLLGALGDRYVFWTGVLNAALFGVPQTRQRAIVIGYRRDLGVVPTAPQSTHLGHRRVFDYRTRRLLEPTTVEGVRALGLYLEMGRPGVFWENIISRLRGAKNLPNLVTVEEAIGDLPAAGDSDDPVTYGTRPPSEYAAALRDGAVWNHRRWQHTEKMLSSLRGVPEGSGMMECAEGRQRGKEYYSQAYTRLHRRGLARTITTNFHNPGSGRFLHYRALRTLTVREAARIQGIADSFVFFGFQSFQERLVGNAFPVGLAEALARHVWSEIGSTLVTLTESRFTRGRGAAA